MNGHLDASRLKDQSIIVTGGASGIGLAAVTRFAEGGAYVTIADVQDAAGNKAAADLNAQGCHVSFVHCDTTDWESSVAAFKHAASFGPSKSLHVAVLNAGIGGDRGSLTDQVFAAPEPSLDPDVVPTRPTRKAAAVNFLGVYDNCWLALHYMRLPSEVDPTGAPHKSIIMTASLAAYADMPNSSDYNASKFAVRGLFRGLRHTTAALNVRVNLLAPYWINTPLVQSALPVLASRGVTPGHGMTWASIDHVVDAMVRSATDPSVGGVAWGIWPEGYFDMGDDEAGGWAGDHLREHWKIQRERGDNML
ncbi:uncharacterized protein Z519_07178 [Cladophialophora bantiana CBS 173.52]|uniref:Uncharacterized protein n=1 Tax=Cladophialophora bantiana (strain ATCC 10958 / CBS 173.52 / CDC B-1940 / NIH 8579) TaxID=1442370 RepID=A0A0D2I5L6_CLAB1|nr:uncharacterized protein Z519_07178 [Cladophialophora bantiana CBS 173.52]KIW92194.1 hypothetical protein Z519_07178 [Cladophialophora bantiana CBS 173.52]